MYLIIDIGGHKTLVGIFQDNQLVKKTSFVTPLNVDKFVIEVKQKSLDYIQNIKKGLVGLKIHNQEFYLSKNTSISINILLNKLEKELFLPFQAEDKIILACRYEIEQINNQQKALYLSLGHSFDYCLYNNGLFFKKDLAQPLELAKNKFFVDANNLISGSAFVARYHQLAKNVANQDYWKSYARDLAQLIQYLYSQFDVETIIIGGAIGKYLPSFWQLLDQEMDQYQLPATKKPDILSAQKHFNNVLYGGNLILERQS